MEPTESSRHFTAKPATRPTGHQRVGDQAGVLTGLVGGRRARFRRALWRSRSVRVVVASRGVVRVAGCVCSVGARGTERKPLAHLGEKEAPTQGRTLEDVEGAQRRGQ